MDLKLGLLILQALFILCRICPIESFRRGEKPTIIEAPESTSVIAKETMVMKCLVDGNPAPLIEWSATGLDVKFGEPIKIAHGSILKIPSIPITNHVLTITCSSSNPLGRVESNAQVKVYNSLQDAPRGFPSFIHNATVMIRQKSEGAELQCHAKGEPTPSIVWYKNFAPINLARDQYFLDNDGTLLIRYIDENDEGTYMCEAKNLHGTRMSNEHQLLVREKEFLPRFLSVPSKRIIIKSGSDVTLNCTAVGNPVPKVNWYRNSKELGSSLKSQYGTSQINLLSVTQSENVSCMANSKIGKVTHHVSVLVKDLEASPKKVVVSEITATSALVSVEASIPRNSKVHVIGYIVHWIEGDHLPKEDLKNFMVDDFVNFEDDKTYKFSKVWTKIFTKSSGKIEKEGSEIHMKLDNLKIFTNYSVVVRMMLTDRFCSEFSDLLFFRTKEKTPEDSPKDVSIVPVGKDSVNISWSPPNIPNGVITDYKIYYHPGNSNELRKVIVHKSELAVIQSRIQTDIHNLAHNEMYHFQISAQNSAGESPLSSTFSVLIQPGVLPAPRNISVIIKSYDEAEVYWEKPFVSDDLISSYLFQIFRSDGTTEEQVKNRTLLKTLTSVTVNSLTPDTEYIFKLAAMFDEKTVGLFSEAKAKTGDYVAPKPFNMTLTPQSSYALTLQWRYPKSDMSIIADGKKWKVPQFQNFQLVLQPADKNGNWLSTEQVKGWPESERRIEKTIPLQSGSVFDSLDVNNHLQSYSEVIYNLRPDTFYIAYLNVKTIYRDGLKAASRPIKTWPKPPKKPENFKVKAFLASTDDKYSLEASWNEIISSEKLIYILKWSFNNIDAGNVLLKNANEIEFLSNISKINSHGLLLGKYQPCSLKISNEIIVNNGNSWSTSSMEFLPGASYTFTVGAKTENQYGQETEFIISIPEIVPSEAPKNLRIFETQFNQSIFVWDPMGLDKRNGPFERYLISCKDKEFIISDGHFRNSYNWPSGFMVVDLELSMVTGEVFCKVAGYNKVGRSPWSEEIRIFIPKKLPPLPPTNVQAGVYDKRVFMSWLPNRDMSVPIEKYRIQLGHCKGEDEENSGNINWIIETTQGPITSKDFYFDDEVPGEICVKLNSIGFNGRESLYTSKYHVMNATRFPDVPVNLNAISCTQNNPNSLNLLWSYNTAINDRISHFKINYTYSSIFVHTNGIKYKRESSEHEVIEITRNHYNSMSMNSNMMQVTTEIPVVPRAIYSISVLPIFSSHLKPFVIPPVGFFNCPMTESQAPPIIERPTFRNISHQTYLRIEKASTINGPIGSYDVLSNIHGEIESLISVSSNVMEKSFHEITVHFGNNRVRRNMDDNSISLTSLSNRKIALRVCTISERQPSCSLSDWSDPNDLGSWIGPREPAPIDLMNFKSLVSSKRSPWPVDTIRVFTSNIENSAQLDDSNQNGHSNSKNYKFIRDTPSLTLNTGEKFTTKITLKTIVIFIGTFITFFCISCLLFVFFVRRRKKKSLTRAQKSSKYSLIQWSNNNSNEKRNDQLASIYKSCNNGSTLQNMDYPIQLPSSNEIPGDIDSVAMSNFMYNTNSDFIKANSNSIPGISYNMNNNLPIDNNGGSSIRMTLAAQGSINSLNGSLSNPGARSRFTIFGNNGLGQAHPLSPSIFSNRPHTSMMKPFCQNEFSTLIKLQDLHEHVSMLKMNSGHLLSMEFDSIDPGGQYTWEHSQNPMNVEKNRYANVIAYDHSRVILKDIPGFDYINANYIDGFMRKNAYIATQGPMTNTFNDFWSMIWQNNSSCIVAITNLEENNRVKCDQYWPNQIKALPQNDASKGNRVDVSNLLMTHSVTFSGGEDGTFYRSPNSSLGTMTYGNIRVTNLSIAEFAYYTIRVFELVKIDTNEKRIIRQFQYTAWSDHFIPNNATPFYLFIRKIRQLTKNITSPIVVHCSAGVGRTGAFIGSDILLSQMEYDEYIDVHGVVTKLRSQRKFMIQTQDQYCFIYEILLESFDCIDKQISIDNFDTYFENNLIKMNQLNCEFRLLNNRTISSNISDPASNMNKGLICPVDQTNTSDRVIKLTSTFRSSDGLPIETNVVALQPINTRKNRSFEIIPHNSNRVVLAEIRGLPGSDYINASLIDGYSRRLAYIAAQAPTEETFEEFWRMIWEAEIRIIVKMNSDHTLENRRSYWPTNETVRFGFLIIDSIAVFEMNFYKIREFSITDTREGHSRTVRQFDVTDALHSIPSTLIYSNDFANIPLGSLAKVSSALIECIDQVNVTKTQFGIESPILVHCEFGAGYTGVYICVSILLEMLQHEKAVDVFSTCKILRWQRRGLVENILDYTLCYSSICEYLKSYN